MASIAQINLVLAILNGLGLIVFMALSVCLALYIVMIKDRLKMDWHSVLFTPPLGLRLAMPMLVLKIGASIYFLIGFSWRTFGNGGSMPLWQMEMLLAAVVVFFFGALWLIRSLTVSRSGELAWLTTLVVMTLYIGGSVIWVTS